jgi:hypothetical protein
MGSQLASAGQPVLAARRRDLPLSDSMHACTAWAWHSRATPGHSTPHAMRTPWQRAACIICMHHTPPPALLQHGQPQGKTRIRPCIAQTVHPVPGRGPIYWKGAMHTMHTRTTHAGTLAMPKGKIDGPAKGAKAKKDPNAPKRALVRLAARCVCVCVCARTYVRVYA